MCVVYTGDGYIHNIPVMDGRKLEEMLGEEMLGEKRGRFL
jgi:hypothetical protein